MLESQLGNFGPVTLSPQYQARADLGILQPAGVSMSHLVCGLSLFGPHLCPWRRGVSWAQGISRGEAVLAGSWVVHRVLVMGRQGSGCLHQSQFLVCHSSRLGNKPVDHFVATNGETFG
uniref:Uncharacterized protein n=1 Tax=Micrurus surinamensis TaxID=129470 RepID=A0A2D4P1W3_MICSU